MVIASLVGVAAVLVAVVALVGDDERRRGAPGVGALTLESSADRSRRAWRGQVAALVALGLAIRLAAVLVRAHLAAGGDAPEYLGQANLLAEGKGFIEPIIYANTHQSVQTAKLPPLYIMVLSICSLAGFKSFLAHRIWSADDRFGCRRSGRSAGKEIAGRRVGLLAALVVAVYPTSGSTTRWGCQRP